MVEKFEEIESCACSEVLTTFRRIWSCFYNGFGKAGVMFVEFVIKSNKIIACRSLLGFQVIIPLMTLRTIPSNVTGWRPHTKEAEFLKLNSCRKQLPLDSFSPLVLYTVLAILACLDSILCEFMFVSKNL